MGRKKKTVPVKNPKDTVKATVKGGVKDAGKLRAGLS